MLSQSEGQMLLDIMDDHGLEQMIPFPSRDKNTLDLTLISLTGQFQDIHSPDKLSDHDILSGFLRIFIPHIKKPRRKIYPYHKGDIETMRKGVLRFANEKFFNTHSDARSVKENLDLITSITKTCLYNFDPLKPHFYIVKLGFTGVYIIFFISAQKHRLWVLVRTASLRRF